MTATGWVRHGSEARMAPVWVALHSGHPGVDGTDNRMTGPGGYHPDQPSWLSYEMVPPGTVRATAGSVEFPLPTPVTPTHFTLWDINGALAGWSEMPPEHPVTSDQSGTYVLTPIVPL